MAQSSDDRSEPLTPADLARLQTEAQIHNHAPAQHKLGMWFINQGSPQGTRNGLAWLNRAASQGMSESQCMLGDIHLWQQHKGDAFYAQGANWYRLAAEQGSATGQVKLAYLYLAGIGVPQDAGKAFKYYEEAAQQDSYGSKSNLAYMYSHGIGVERDENKASLWYANAAAVADPRGFYSIGLRLLNGTEDQNRYAKATVLFEHASALEYPGSQDLLEQLSATLTSSQIRRAAEFRDQLDKHLAEHAKTGPGSALGPWLVRETAATLQDLHTCKPPSVDVLSWSPRVFKIGDFLSVDECDHLIHTATRNPQPTEKESGKSIGNPSRRLHSGLTTYFFPPICDATTYNIDARIEKTTWIPASFCETLSVLKYGIGNDYAQHVDYYNTDDPSGARFCRDWGQRVITFLMYLNDVESGGETEYVQAAGVKVTPRKGTAVMHFNCLPSGEIDEMSTHAGLPVLDGEKWLARKAICDRDNRLPINGPN